MILNSVRKGNYLSCALMLMLLLFFYLAGSCLTNLGKAHCKVATLQEAYAVTFQDTFLSSIEKFGDEIREYDQVKKKLESRRYDPSISDTLVQAHILV